MITESMHELSIDRLIISDENPEIFKKDPALGEAEQLQQAKEVVKFITTPIPENYLSGEAWARVEKESKNSGYDKEELMFPHSPLDFMVLLMASYSQDELLELLLTETFGKPSKTFRKKYLRLKKELYDKKYLKTRVAEDIKSLIYEPEYLFTAFYNVIAQNIRDEIGDISQHNQQSLMETPVVQDLQARLILKLIKRNKHYNLISRNLSFDSFFRENSSLDVTDFFCGQDIHESDKQDISVSKYLFGFLTCHIGYFKIPQHGKWEAVYSDACRQEFAWVLKKEVAPFERTEGEIQKDIFRQRKAESILFRFIVNKYTSLYNGFKDYIDEQEIKSEEMHESFAELKKEFARLSKLVSELIEEQNESQNNSQLDIAKIRRDIELEYEKQYAPFKKIKSGFEKLQKQLQRYEQTNKKLTSDLKETKAELTSTAKENEEYRQVIGYLERMLANQTKEPIYNVVVEIKRARRKKFTSTHESILEQAIIHLSNHIFPEKPFIKTGGNWGHKRLKKAHPKYDTFHKIEMPQNYRVPYAYKGLNTVAILDVMSHSEYDNLIKPHK